MVSIVITGVTETQRGIKKIFRDTKKTGVLFNRLGRAFRDDARRRITTQDGGTYDKLSPWTRARTGRRKAFVTEKKNITFRIVGDRLDVGHFATGWSFAMHEQGFITPGFKGKAVTIPLKNPAALRDIRGNSITIRSSKASVVPARQVFANPAQAQAILSRITRNWINKIITRAGAK